MKTFKIKDWKKSIPFRYYLFPLEDALNKVRKELLRMDEVGHFFHGKLTDLKEVVENFVK